MHRKVAIAMLLIVTFGVAAFAVEESKEAKLKVTVVPAHAYVFLDNTPIGPGSRDLFMSAGEHTVGVYAYGWNGLDQTVTLQPGKNTPVNITLQPKGEPITAEFGILQIEGPGRAVVLMNGKTPDYTVGHVDMFNNHIGWFQQLIVPPATHNVTVTFRTGEVWSGPVAVAANQRVILYVPSGKMKTESWSDGTKAVARPRSQVGTASAAVALAPVSGNIEANPPMIQCHDTSKLAYASSETLHAAIHNGAENTPMPSTTGEHAVTPVKTTTYDFTASGPGGVVNKNTTVQVDPAIESSIAANPPEVHYLKIGEKVLTQEPTDIKWQTEHADAAALNGNPTSDLNGRQTMTLQPTQATTGAVSETFAYNLASSNICGGSDSKATSVQMTGMVEPYVLSIFFPTGYPARKNPSIGLVKSQQDELVKLAQAFKIYAEHTPEAKLFIRGHADPRSSNRYNLKLSERRVEITKAFLIAQGIAPEKIETDAVGKTQALDRQAVAQLESENPLKAERKRNVKTTRLAYNRRVDVQILPVAVESSRYFPHTAVDSKLIWQRAWPGLSKVKAAQ